MTLFAIGSAAFARAWIATRGTALFHAVHWGAAAWLAWMFAIFIRITSRPFEGFAAPINPIDPNPFFYVALCLTGCAGVAVLGARRPHVAAWNFVVASLFAVMVLPLIEKAVIGTQSLDWLRITFLATTLAIGILNYLPTRFGPAAFLLALGCAGELIGVLSNQPLPEGAEEQILRLCVLSAALLAFARRLPGATDALNLLWREFRDRWGLVWGLRVREQFNRSAANAGWPVTLTWFGFTYQKPVDAATRTAISDALSGLLHRFVDEKK